MKQALLLNMLVLCCTASISAQEIQTGESNRGGTHPNVLFIAVDDLNHWVTHLNRNRQARTPNIDRLASMGMTFTRAYCAAPACEPSRAALMSGKRPWTTGCYKNGDSWKNHLTEGQQLSKQFLQAGYYVAGAGKIFHSDQYFPSEWSEYMDSRGLYVAGKGVEKDNGYHLPLSADLADDDLMDWHTVNWCIDKINQSREQPFFIACGLHKPHLPFAVPRKYYDAFPLNEIELPPHQENDLDDIPEAGRKMANPAGDHAKFLKSGRWKAAIQSYLATCAYTDMNIGRLLDALEKSKAHDNTVIVLWGDHGWSFGEKQHWRKFALWEEPTRTPLIFVAPGTTKAGSVCEHPVDLMAIYPTTCQLAGLPVPAHVEGTSVVPLLRNAIEPWSLAAITTHGQGNHAVRLGPWRYIRYADGSEELYDHSSDEYEWNNVANRAQLDHVKSDLAKYLPQDKTLNQK
ncbi:MAG: sulfatase [Planctomycetaceae bacterium]|nr:sulfatase [Planctomycetaceae bacterium]